jgi:transcriptional regulator with XRE-family HTH domain
MIRTDKIIGMLAEKGITQAEMAEKLGVSPKTFYSRMKKGVFTSTEMDIMIDVLRIDDPRPIFFADKVS